MVQSRNAKLLVFGLVAVLVLQFAVAHYWSEPFPAVIMPGFPGSPPTTGRTAIRSYRVVATSASGAEFTADAPTFFNALPRWYTMTDLPFVLDSTPAEASWRHVRAHLSRRSKLRSDAGVESFVTYARGRLAALTGRTDWAALRIEELRRDFDIDGMNYVGSARVDRSREFSLR